MCLLVSFAGIMPVRSQEKTKMVTVEGTVVDETETPVIGANVYIKGSTKGVSTNVNGNFIFTGVPVGQTVTVSFIGYKDYQVRVTKGGEKLRITWLPRLQRNKRDVDPEIPYELQLDADVIGKYILYILCA